MIFGYTLFDPVIVLAFAAMAIYFLVRSPVRLMPWLPTALTAYFFIPFVTLLTVGQVVSMILTARILVRAKINSAPRFIPVLVLMFLCFVVSASLSFLVGQDFLRTVLRSLYYFGLLAIFAFSFEMIRRDGAYESFVRGLALLGIALTIYGLYQVFAIFSGLPLRGIVRGVYGAQVAFEGGILRINSFASEPKRLGYVMFVCALACFEWARLKPNVGAKYRRFGYLVLGTSALTFAGSYFIAMVLFVLIMVVLFPSRATKLVFAVLAGVIILSAVPETRLAEIAVNAYERRAQEVEVGLDGAKVYRQEFYAEDYLVNNPGAIIFGVGLGQYYGVLNREYGAGVGIGEDGKSLLPLNSAVLETLFDLSGMFVLLMYASLAYLIWRLRRSGEKFLCLALLFVVLQSFTIQSLTFVVMLAGVASAKLVQRQRVANARLMQARFPVPA